MPPLQHEAKEAQPQPKQTNWSVDYLLTVTMSPMLKRTCTNAPEQHDFMFRQNTFLMDDLFNRKGIKTRYSGVCELTQKFDLHFHFIISFDLDTIPKRYKIYIPFFMNGIFKTDKHFGFIDIQPIRDFKLSSLYLRKELHQSRDLLGYDNVRSVIIKDDYNIFFDDKTDVFGWTPAQSLRLRKNEDKIDYVYKDDELAFYQMIKEKKSKFIKDYKYF